MRRSKRNRNIPVICHDTLKAYRFLPDHTYYGFHRESGKSYTGHEWYLRNMGCEDVQRISTLY